MRYSLERGIGSRYGGDHHLYVDFFDQDGQDARSKIAELTVRTGGRWTTISDRKPAGEPAFNVPIWPNDTVAVQAGGTVVDGISSSYPLLGEDLYHVSWYLRFFLEDEEPSGNPAAKSDEIEIILSMIEELKKRIGVLRR